MSEDNIGYSSQGKFDPYQQQPPYQQPPYQQPPYQQTPYQQTPYQQTPYQQQPPPYQQPPYQQQQQQQQQQPPYQQQPTYQQPTYHQPTYHQPPYQDEETILDETPVSQYGGEEIPFNSSPPPYAPLNYHIPVQVPVISKQGFYIVDLLLWILELALLVSIIFIILDSYLGVSIVIAVSCALVIVIVVILVRLYISPTSKYLRNILHQHTATGYVDSFRPIAPKVKMSIECYHYVTIVKRIQHGNTYRTETRKKKVVTYTDSREFAYDLSADYSGQIVGLEQYRIAKLNLKSEILFADDYTRQCYMNEESAFIASNKYRDVYYNFNREMFIPGLEGRVLTFVDPSQIPFYINFKFYLLSHILLLQYPYILLFRAKSTKLVFQYRKTISKTPL